MATLSEIRSNVRNLIFERTSDPGLVTDTELNNIINIAARMLFLRVASKWPEPFAKRSTASVNIAFIPVGFDTFFTVNAKVLQVLDVRAGTTGTPEFNFKPVKPLNKLRDKDLYDEGVLAPSGSLPSRYYIEGKTIGFSPYINGTFDVRLSWVEMPTDMVADTDKAWDGKVEAFHDSISILASIIALSKENNDISFKGVFQYIDSIMEELYGPPGASNDANLRSSS